MQTKLLVKTINSYYEYLNLTCRVKEYDGAYVLEDIPTGAWIDCHMNLHKTLTRAIKLADAQMKLDRATEASKEAQRHVLTFMVRDLGAETVQQWLADIQDESEAESLMGSPEIKAELNELFKPKRK
jgi:hypothetical protein